MSICNEPFQDAVRLKGLALRGLVDLFRGVFVVTTTTPGANSAVFINRSTNPPADWTLLLTSSPSSRPSWQHPTTLPLHPPDFT